MRISLDNKLTEQATEYEATKRERKQVASDYKAEVESHDLFATLRGVKTKAKRLNERIHENKLIQELKEEKDRLKDRMDLLKEIIKADMSSNQVNMFAEHEGEGVFIVTQKIDHKKK